LDDCQGGVFCHYGIKMRHIVINVITGTLNALSGSEARKGKEKQDKLNQ